MSETPHSELPEFKVGDLVTLKSGGPSMTVNGEKRDDDLVTCQWFDGRELHTDAFDSPCLVRFEEAACPRCLTRS